MYGMGQWRRAPIIGIPKGSPHPEDAWLLVSCMATDTDTLVYMANTARNVPTTYAVCWSHPTWTFTPQFQTFLDILTNRRAPHYKETSAIGQADQDLMASFMEKWQAGKVPDLQAGLDEVAEADQRPTVAGTGAIEDARPSSSTGSSRRRRAAGLPSSSLAPRGGGRRGGPWCVPCSCRRGSSGSSSSSLYPMVSSLYFSFTHYDLLQSPHLGRVGQLQVHVHEDSVFWKAIKNTVWFIVVGRAAADRVRDRRRPRC